MTAVRAVPGSIALVCALQRQPVACGLLRPDGSPKALHTPRAPRSYMSDETDETMVSGLLVSGTLYFTFLVLYTLLQVWFMTTVRAVPG